MELRTDYADLARWITDAPWTTAARTSPAIIRSYSAERELEQARLLIRNAAIERDRARFQRLAEAPYLRQYARDDQVDALRSFVDATAPRTSKAEPVADEPKGPYDYSRGDFDPTYIAVKRDERYVDYWLTDGAVEPTQVRFMLIRYYNTPELVKKITGMRQISPRGFSSPSVPTEIRGSEWNSGTSGMTTTTVTWFNDKWHRRIPNLGRGNGTFENTWIPITEEDGDL